MTTTLASALGGPETLFAPLCLDALSARLASDAGFAAGYLSGGALGYSYAVSEALLTLTEIADVTRMITQRSEIELIVDAGVGFGDAVHTARMVWELESAGAAAIELEDQVAPKRVSHHRGIEHLVPVDVMVGKIGQAAAERRGDRLLIIARTGAVRNEGFAQALDRLRAYRDAGADVLMLMPENEQQIKEARQALDAPLATITTLDARTPAAWSALGWNLVIDPITPQVLALEAVRNAYLAFQKDGRTGEETRVIFERYRQLPGLAGLDPLFAIEDATTEKG